MSVSQGNTHWQISAGGYGIISQDHKLGMELTFSSALFCLPFSTSPSEAMLVNVRGLKGVPSACTVYNDFA